MRTVAAIGLWTVAGLTALACVWLVGMRRGWRPVRTGMRTMIKHVFNPRARRTAGSEGSWAALVHHVGRTSGAAYTTPVVAVATADGFAIALPYGSESDWVRNVLAAGSARLDLEGAHHDVTDPRIVDAEEGNRHFPDAEQRQHRLFRIDEFLLLRRATA